MTRTAMLASLVVVMMASCGDAGIGRRGACEGVAVPQGVCSCAPGNVAIEPLSECSARTLGTPNILCCRGPTQCLCTRVECEDGFGGCACNFATRGASSCTGPVCCNSTGDVAGQCYCSDLECTGSSVRVASCSVGGLTCGDGETRVEACTP